MYEWVKNDSMRDDSFPDIHVNVPMIYILNTVMNTMPYVAQQDYIPQVLYWTDEIYGAHIMTVQQKITMCILIVITINSGDEQDK